MWRAAALSLPVLSFCLAGAPALSAGPDPNFAAGLEPHWSASPANRPILPSPAVTLPATLILSQAQSQTTPPSGDAASAAIPDDAIKAEMEKRWGDAERIYRELLVKEAGRVDLLLRLNDVLAVQGKRVEAAETMARAADLRPNDANLQTNTSAAFAAADRPADALRYVDRALAIRPDDLDLHDR